MKTNPVIGIALAAYLPNIEFFETQLRSIQTQTYTNWFCIIGCDSSLDRLRGEERLASFFQEPRFLWRQNEKSLGASGNFKETIKACVAEMAELIACSDQDDRWHANKLERMVARMTTLPPESVLHCDMNVWQKKENGDFELLESTTGWSIERRGVHNVSSLDFMIRNIVAGAGILFDAELARAQPDYPPELFYHDHWFPLVASYRGGVHALHEQLYDYRIHGSNVAGISEYRGLFAASADSRRQGVLSKCRAMFSLSEARCSFAESVGLPVSSLQRWVAKSRWDLGALYIVKGLRHLIDDRMLVRACLVRAFGKLLTIISGS